ncbi:ester cyclase [Oscillatoria amoena NRMC-F 0135]|nr:ester cyclase [Oscillatoria amoena NRMC-F 0135]
MKKSFIMMIVIAISSCNNTRLSNELLGFQKQAALESMNIDVVHNFYKGLDTQDTVLLNSLIDKDFKSFFGSSDEPVNFYELKPLIKEFYTAFPDYRHNINRVFAADDVVVCLVTFTGTHRASFMGQLPGGNKVKYNGVQTFRIKDGRITELYEVADDLTFMKQLGLALK